MTCVCQRFIVNFGMDRLHGGETLCVRLGSSDPWETRIVENFVDTNEVWMPVWGLGMSYQQESAANRRSLPTPAAFTALNEGYRLFDTASRYRTEEALGAAICSSKVPREHLFITSKLWAAEYGRANTQYEEQCRRIGTDYLDCYLIHWPEPWNSQGKSNRESRAETWRQLELLLESGKCRSIGVSNFLPIHLEQLIEDCTITPHINQFEYNPLQQSKEIVASCREQGIVAQGYCPLAKGNALRVPLVQEMASQLGKSPAQVLLRWSLQNNVAIIPKASSQDHIRSNKDIFDFSLTAEQMAKLDSLHQNYRCTWDPTGIE
mmetsp:Transcript_11627/g.14445  ORF Transcript_11627/g.14445 Transcript_11627/m.14445 type:complete len:320 (+) Transcript_11627:1-960(+)